MAIVGPQDLPVVLKLNPDPMKAYCLAQLGYPGVNVEISEAQFEIALRVTCDFICGYFPREQKLAMFYTQPLVSSYPMPEDAYWIQEVQWDPVTTRIDDVFGAESFLFCMADNFKVLDKDGRLQPIADWKPHWKAKTPFGRRSLKIVKRKIDRLMPKRRLFYDGGVIEATTSHVVKANSKWREFGEVNIGDRVHGVKNMFGVQNVECFESTDAISIRANGAGCYFGCTEGEPIIIH
jgi:hypothetical protein